MRNLIPILLAVVLLSSGCDSALTDQSGGHRSTLNAENRALLEDIQKTLEELQSREDALIALEKDLIKRSAELEDLLAETSAKTQFTNCGDLVSHEGYDYTTVQIGGQCWFSENCRYLPSVSPSSASSNYEPYYYVYDYEGTHVKGAQATVNYATYGVLYNWPAVMTEGICPSGWHIPSDGEWQTMEISLGMSESEAAGRGRRGPGVGYQMKSTKGWWSNGTNSSGFNGLPGGYRYRGFHDYEDEGSWWTSSEFGSDSWDRSIDNDEVSRLANTRRSGNSARCVRD